MIMKTSISPIWFLLAATLFGVGLCHGVFHSGCTESEREALLQFKLGLHDPGNRLSSWGADANCCGWYGVICDNLTNHVIELHLTTLSDDEYYASNESGDYETYQESSTFGGKISQSLLNFKHLKYLDLSNNNFQGIRIPKFIGSIGSLRYLNLSRAGFGGMIPHELGNLSNLQHLDVRGDYQDKFADGLHWLSSFHSLEFLDMSLVNLSKALDWLDVMNKLPSLVELHLSGCSLSSKVPHPNVNFSSLAILHLSSSFPDSQVPSWIFSISTLTSLDLSFNYFHGSIPFHLHNITFLKELDLCGNQFNSSVALWSRDFTHLELLNLASNGLQEIFPNATANFTSLKSLDISQNYFGGAIPSAISNLTSLGILDLSFNELEGGIPSAIGNLTSLGILDLSFNKLEGGIPASFKNLCNLRSLYLSEINLSQEINEVFEILGGCVSDRLHALSLSNSQLSGFFNDLLGRFKNLKSLDLSDNLIACTIPMSLGELTSLTFLDLSHNKLNGSLPANFGALEELIEVDISHNSLEGEVSEIHFVNLTNLRNFDGSYNHLSLRVKPGWFPPFQFIKSITLRSWDVGSQFPAWLRSLKHLRHLDLSNSKISSTLPLWFHDWSSRLYNFNLSNNQMHGKIPYLSIDDSDYSSIDLSSNNFEGPLPYVFSNPGGIDLSNNSFYGSISPFLCNKLHRLNFEKSFHHYLTTKILNLGKNLLSGEIPDCWMNWKSVAAVQLNDNYFSGKIPRSLGTLSGLSFLNLHNNNLSGQIPSSLKHCKQMSVLDLGENGLSGNIPTWLGRRYYDSFFGEQISSMLILNLRGNKFHGHIPKEFCHMTSLQILDLADNNFSGTIPPCVRNFTAMVNGYHGSGNLLYAYGPSLQSVQTSLVMTKGVMREYSTILNFVRSMDLSNNKLSGNIPKEIIKLEGLQSLNLSNNLLSERIPEEIGNMRALESLDLSQNHLFGEIPASMASLTFLSRLNLSNNKLSGKIPTGPQFQGFDPSSFSGNELCGPPLTKNCSVDGGVLPPIETKRGENGKEFKSFEWFYFYVSIAPGFVVGFWAVVGPLVFNRRWRLLYFNFLERLWDIIVVWYHVNVVRIVRGHGS